MKLIHYLISVMIVFNTSSYAKNDYSEYIYNPEIDLTTDYPENIDFVKTLMNSYAVDLFGGKLTETKVDSIIKSIKNELKAIPSQKITITDLIYLYRTKLMDKATETESHFQLVTLPYFQKNNVNFSPNKLNVLPFRLLIIGDTAIVDMSQDSSFKRGDRVISVNDIPVNNFIEYYYPRRYVNGIMLQNYYHFTYAKKYNIKIERKGKIKTIRTKGVPSNATLREKPPKYKKIIFKGYNAGYFEIPDFFCDNCPQRVEELSSFIDRLQKMNIANVIIDVRRNGGGCTYYFPDFFSMMSDKKEIFSQKSGKIRLSEYSVDKEEDEWKEIGPENYGEIRDLSEDVDNIYVLNPKKFKKGMNYYIMVSSSTFSSAARFVDLIQYYDIGVLVGESLALNANTGGDTFWLKWNNSDYIGIIMTGKVTVPYSKAKNNEIKPDIEIPYNASEYMSGGDPQLEKLLKIIKK